MCNKSASAQIREYVTEHHPDGEVPYGLAAELARRFGVSRQVATYVFRGMDVNVGHSSPREEAVTCFTCEEKFRRRSTELKKNKGLRFCSRTCFDVWNSERLRELGRTRALKTHCKRGHEFTPENTYRGSRGRRVCATCARRRGREYYRRRQAALHRD